MVRKDTIWSVSRIHSVTGEARVVQGRQSTSSLVVEPTSGSMPSAGIPLTKASRALFARLLFVIHGLVAIWRVVSISKNSVYWSLTAVLVIIFIEGAVVIFTRNGNESRWFCVCIFLYLCAVVPSLWLLQLELSPAMKSKRNTTVTADNSVSQGYTESARLDLGGISVSVHIPIDNDLWLQLLQQTMLVTVILGRWILPKGDISRDQLSQLLLVFLAMGADIVELFDTFKENVVRTDLNLSFVVLGVWTVSLMQFPLILTGGRQVVLPEGANMKLRKKGDKYSKRPRLAAHTKSIETRHSLDSTDSRTKPRSSPDKDAKPGAKRPAFTQVLHLLTADMGFWSIITSTFLQDVPYLTTRLYLLIAYKTNSFTMIFFTCKNVLVVILQWYRLLVITCEYRKRVRFAAYFLPYCSTVQDDIGDQINPMAPKSANQPDPLPREKAKQKLDRRMSLISIMSAIKAANKSKQSMIGQNLAGLKKASEGQQDAGSCNRQGKGEEGRLPVTLEEEEDEVLFIDENDERPHSPTSSVFNVCSSESCSLKGSVARQYSFGSLSATAVPYYFAYASGSPPLGSGHHLRKHRSLDNDSGIGFPFLL